MATNAEASVARTTEDSAAPPPTDTDEVKERQERADAIVRRNIYWALGAGAIPVPLADFAAITAVQLKMLRELSKEYDIPFLEHKVKNIVGSLISSSLAIGGGTTLVFSVLKVVPVIGTAAGFVSMSMAAGAITYATGRVFVQHFESGGTFLDFDPKKVRSHFKKEMEKGKEVAAKVKAEKP